MNSRETDVLCYIEVKSVVTRVSSDCKNLNLIMDA